MVSYTIRPLLFLLLALTLSGCTFGRQTAPTPIPINIPATSGALRSAENLVAVQRGDIVDIRSFPGEVSLATQEDLFFGASGRVQRLYVESGDLVTEGDLIAELDTRNLSLDIELAEKAARMAEQQVTEAQEVMAYDRENAQRNLDIAKLRLKALTQQEDPDPIAVEIQQLEIDRAQAALDRIDLGLDTRWEYDLERLTAEMDKAVVALMKLESSRSDAQIIAPFDGEVRLYEALAGGKAVQAAQAFEPVASIVDPDSLQIEANLVSEDLELLYEGMPVKISPVNQPSLLIEGEVSRLPQPFGTGVSTLTEVTLNGEASTLRPGMSMEIIIELARSDDTLWLPIEALRGFNQNYYVEVRDGAATREAPVTIGLRGEDKVEILSGLSEGDQVVSQ